MKKALLTTMFICTLSLTACGSEASTNTTAAAPTVETTVSETAVEETTAESMSALEAVGSVTVEKELFDVKLTIPADFIGETTQEELEVVAKENGYKVVLNEDGSATYEMTKSQHKAFMDDIKGGLVESLNEMIESEEYPSFTDIKYNDNFTEFVITTTNTELSFTESFSTLAFYMYGGIYNIYNGTPVDNVHIEYVNADSGEVIYSSDSADAEGSEDPIAESSKVSSNLALDFQEVVIADNDECSIVISEVDPNNMWGFTLKAKLENKSEDKNYMFSVSDAYINGVQADPLFAAEVAAGKKSNEEISFSTSALEENGIIDFTDIEMHFNVHDSEDWMADSVFEEVAHIYPYGEENATLFVRESQDTDTIIVDNEYVTAIVTSYETHDIWGYTANLFLVNKTDAEVMFSTDNVSVNGYMLDPFFATSIAPGKCKFTTMSWATSELEDNDIELVEEIEMEFRAHYTDDWSANDLFDEVVVLNP